MHTAVASSSAAVAAAATDDGGRCSDGRRQRQRQLQRRRVRAGEHRLAVDVVGARGPAVLLLHGFPDDGSIWDAQADALADAG